LITPTLSPFLPDDAPLTIGLDLASGPDVTALRIVDDYGTVRDLVSDGPDQYRGYLMIDGEPMPYWLPRGIVESWIEAGA
jgi:hypothetical protein